MLEKINSVREGMIRLIGRFGMIRIIALKDERGIPSLLCAKYFKSNGIKKDRYCLKILLPVLWGQFESKEHLSKCNMCSTLQRISGASISRQIGDCVFV